ADMPGLPCAKPASDATTGTFVPHSDESARLFRPRSGLQIQEIMPGANTNSHTNRTRWLSHADKSIAGENGRRGVSQAAGAADALGPCRLMHALQGGGQGLSGWLFAVEAAPAVAPRKYQP